MHVLGSGLLLIASFGFGHSQDAKQTIATVVAREEVFADQKGQYVYFSEERSDRTGGHLWLERVAETKWGKVKYLLAEDGHPLTGARLAAEKARLARAAADPELFKLEDAARATEEAHAKQLLLVLGKAYLFDPAYPEGDTLRIPFRPNPDFSPSGMEERVLHGMSGVVMLDAKTLRLKGIEGRLAQDVSIGFGLATIRAGSNFSTLRGQASGDDWKMQTQHSDFFGRALLLKALARKQDAKHWGFQQISDATTVAEAVKLVETP
jgi:hypothetical protein